MSSTWEEMYFLLKQTLFFVFQIPQKKAATPTIWMFVLEGKNFAIRQKYWIKQVGIDFAPILEHTTLNM